MAEQTWIDRAKEAPIGRSWRGGTYSIHDDFVNGFMRALAAADQETILDLHGAAKVIVTRIDDQIARDLADSAERQRRRERQAEDDRIIDGRYEDVKRRAAQLRDSSKMFNRYDSRSFSSRVAGKPEPFAAPDSGTIRASRIGTREGACVRCGRNGKYAAPTYMSWTAPDGTLDEYGMRKSESGVEIIAVCGQHARDTLIGIAIAELAAEGALPEGTRYGSSRRGYGTGIRSVTLGRFGDDVGLFDAWKVATGKLSQTDATVQS